MKGIQLFTMDLKLWCKSKLPLWVSVSYSRIWVLSTCIGHAARPLYTQGSHTWAQARPVVTSAGVHAFWALQGLFPNGICPLQWKQANSRSRVPTLVCPPPKSVRVHASLYHTDAGAGWELHTTDRHDSQILCALSSPPFPECFRKWVCWAAGRDSHSPLLSSQQQWLSTWDEDKRFMHSQCVH